MIENPLEALQELKDAISQESCVLKEPFVKLGIGTASILNYNLPQQTCYSAFANIVLKIDADKFKDPERTAPVTSFWDVLPKRDLESIRLDYDTRTTIVPNQYMLSDFAVVNNRSARLNSEGVSYESLDQDTPAIAARSVLAEPAPDKVYYPMPAKDYITLKTKQGYMPIPIRHFSNVQDVVYLPRPKAAKPVISIVLHMKVCSFLGDYGAGATLKTFSLYPGEKVEITIRHYLRNETTRKQSQHILDSYSQSCADDMQTALSNEITKGSDASFSSDFNFTNNFQTGGSLNMNFGIGSAGFNGSGGHTIGMGNSMNSVISNLSTSMQSAINHHVSSADTMRQIDINTETTSTFISEDEETIKRTIENYNKSRVLNFVYRQLMQQYLTIMYLDDVTFEYTNGYPERNRTCQLSNLEDMLTDLLVDGAAVLEVQNQIYAYLCNIVDNTGTKVSFIEKVTESLDNCINTTATTVNTSYIRKRSTLTQTFEGKTVNGIILSTQERIIRTPSLVCDALLGQGEALDCYNQHLQDAAATNTHLKNLELVQQLASIELITDPLERATAYKKIFGNCCETPQTQIIP